MSTAEYRQQMKDKFLSGGRVRATERQCCLCRVIKPATDFYLSNTDGTGLHGWCKPCSDQRTTENGRKRIGCSPEMYEGLFAFQDGRCAICGVDQPRAGKRSFCVDHDHVSGKVRGLLCTRCNTMIGNAKDDTTILAKAMEYLRRAR